MSATAGPALSMISAVLASRHASPPPSPRPTAARPGTVVLRFCLVAFPIMRSALLLRPAADPEQEPNLRLSPPVTWLVVLRCSSGSLTSVVAHWVSRRATAPSPAVATGAYAEPQCPPIGRCFPVSPIRQRLVRPSRKGGQRLKRLPVRDRGRRNSRGAIRASERLPRGVFVLHATAVCVSCLRPAPLVFSAWISKWLLLLAW